MKLTITEIQRHRNGISGAPFHAVTFRDREHGPMFAVVFEQPHHVAVFQLEKLASGDIEFGSNSWRGDQFEPFLRSAIDLHEEMEGFAPFDAYEISPCLRIEEPDRPGQFYFEPCEPHEAHVWTLYGHIPGEGVEAIGDFATRDQAEEVYARITGQPYQPQRNQRENNHDRPTRYPGLTARSRRHEHQTCPLGRHRRQGLPGRHRHRG